MTPLRVRPLATSRGRTAQPAASTLGDLLTETATRLPRNPCVVYRGDVLTYAAIEAEAEAGARSLLALGTRRGDRVACLLSNRPEWVIVALAAAKLGAIVVPLNTWFKRNELGWALRHTGASTLVAEDSFLSHDYAGDLESIDPSLARGEPAMVASTAFPLLRNITLVGRRRPWALTWDDFRQAGSTTTTEELTKAQARVRSDDPLFIVYTSGSTADPKGVVLRHQGVVENSFNIGQRRELGPTDRVWLGSPLFYGLGAVNAFPACLNHGCALVLQGHFTASSALEVIEAERCTVFYGMSNMIRQIYESPDYRRDRVESLSKGTAGISVEERRILLSEMGVSLATQSYGLTEVYGNCFGGFVDDTLEVKLGTCGAPLPGFDYLVVDPESRRQLPPGKEGLLLVRGYTTDSYFENPPETARSIDADGFFDTGDLGSFGRDGYFRVSGRLKEVVKTGGINVSPSEVEAVLLRHPAVREAYVVGIPDEARGEALVAFVSTNGTVTDQELKDYTREMVASFKTPAHVLFRTADELPRTASGKVPRFRLREQAIEELG